jgi:lipid-binding SYLF domain-containing protein
MKLWTSILAAAVSLSFAACRTTGPRDAEGSDTLEVNNPALGVGQMSRIADATSEAAEAVHSALRAADLGGNRIVSPDLLAQTKCIIGLRITKGAILLGGGGGGGMMACRHPEGGWSAPSYVRTGGFDLSAAIGFQSMDMTIFITDAAVAQSYKGQGNLDAKPFISAVAASADLALAKVQQYGLVAVQTDVTGLYAGVGINFSSLSHMQADRNQFVYSQVLGGQVGTPADLDGRLCSTYLLPGKRQQCIADYNARTGGGMAPVTVDGIFALQASNAPQMTKPFNDELRAIN